MSTFPWYLLHIVSSCIYLAVLLCAFIFALINWSKSPRAAVMLVAGLSIILLSDLTKGCVPYIIRTTNANAQFFSDIFSIVHIVTSIATSCGILLIAIAVFIDRKIKPAINKKFDTIETIETVTFGTNDNPYHVSQPSRS